MGTCQWNDYSKLIFGGPDQDSRTNREGMTGNVREDIRKSASRKRDSSQDPQLEAIIS
jgi:hypothetical protein